MLIVPKKAIDIINQAIIEKVDEKTLEIPVRLFIGGMQFDIIEEDRSCGEIGIHLDAELCCSENNKLYRVVETKEEE